MNVCIDVVLVRALMFSTIAVMLLMIDVLIYGLFIYIIYLLYLQIPETYTNRSPELDFVIAKHEAPSVRLPYRLPSRPRSIPTEQREDDNNDEDPTAADGIADRLFFKTAALNIIKKSNKLNKIGDESKMLLQSL